MKKFLLFLLLIPLICFAFVFNFNKQVKADTISDLTGYTWVCTSNFSGFVHTYYINFTCNNHDFSTFSLVDYLSTNERIQYLKYDNYFVYTYTYYPQTTPSWLNNGYKTIVITGGVDTTNSNLIEFLSYFGTLTAPQPSTTDIYINNTLLGSYDPDDLIRVNPTGLYNSTLSQQIYTYSGTGAFGGFSITQNGTLVYDISDFLDLSNTLYLFPYLIPEIPVYIDNVLISGVYQDDTLYVNSLGLYNNTRNTQVWTYSGSGVFGGFYDRNILYDIGDSYSTHNEQSIYFETYIVPYYDIVIAGYDYLGSFPTNTYLEVVSNGLKIRGQNNNLWTYSGDFVFRGFSLTNNGDLSYGIGDIWSLNNNLTLYVYELTLSYLEGYSTGYTDALLSLDKVLYSTKTYFDTAIVSYYDEYNNLLQYSGSFNISFENDSIILTNITIPNDANYYIITYIFKDTFIPVNAIVNNNSYSLMSVNGSVTASYDSVNNYYVYNNLNSLGNVNTLDLKCYNSFNSYSLKLYSLLNDYNLIIESYNRGYSNGESSGYYRGYAVGLQDGYDETNYFGSAMLSVVDIPFKTFEQAFSFNLFGINIYYIVMGFLTLGVVIYIWRKLR